MTPEEVKSIVRETVAETLGAWGIDTTPDHLQKTQADFLWLRKTRESSESFRKATYITILIAMVGFFGAVLWDAVSMLAKNIVMGWTGK